jgi:hypothetical protein
MECAIDEELAEKLAAAGYFYILHRFSVDTVAFMCVGGSPWYRPL